MKVETLSATQLGMLKRCPRQWYYRYAEGIKLKPPGSWANGTVGHEVAKTNFIQKVETQNDLPVDTCQDMFRDIFTGTSDAYEWSSESEFAEEKDSGIRAIGKWREVTAPPLMPASKDHVESRFEIPFEGVDYKLIGYIDLETNETVDDFKFVSKRWNADSAANELQPYCYSLKSRLDQAIEFEKAKIENREAAPPDPKLFRYHITTTAKDPKSQTVNIKINDEQLNNFLKDIAEAYEMIEKECFPSIWKNYMCSPSSCGYYQMCRGAMTSEVVIFEHDEVKTRKKKGE